MPFLNAERFIEEAIRSVLDQTYGDWELLLVDDGSTDRTASIARAFASTHSRKVRYLAQPGGRNLGTHAARDLGLRHSRGEYVALLDADDVWLPEKLEVHVPRLEACPEAVMLYGQTLYWHGWTGDAEAAARDRVPELGVPAGTLVRPPDLLTRYLRREAAVPCTCSLLARRDVVERVGAFRGDFFDLYTDQVFYAKMILAGPVLVLDGWHEKYRRHASSSWERARHSGRDARVRKQYLDWLSGYVRERGVRDPALRRALRRERRRLDHPALTALLDRAGGLASAARRLLLRGAN